MIWAIFALILAFVYYRTKDEPNAAKYVAGFFCIVNVLIELYILSLSIIITNNPDGIVSGAQTWLVNDETKTQFIVMQKVDWSITKYLISLFGASTVFILLYYGYVEVMRVLKTMQLIS